MKRAIAISLLLATSLLAAPDLTAADDSEEIVTVIRKAYVEGLWQQGDEQAARGGFDPAFVMQVAQEDHVISASLGAWMERLGLSGEPLREGITAEVTVLDRAGHAAVAKVEVFADGEPLYTDYMSLYKIAGGWRIVAKTFHSH